MVWSPRLQISLHAIRDYFVEMGDSNPTTESVLSEAERLQALNDALAKEIWPVALIIVFLAFVGFAGNLVTIYIFGFRLRMNTQHLLMSALAAFDLLTNVLIIPIDTWFTLNYVMAPTSDVCRLLFVSLIPSLCSAWTPVAIAVDRYLLW
jgi:hypothetical protein